MPDQRYGDQISFGAILKKYKNPDTVTPQTSTSLTMTYINLRGQTSQLYNMHLCVKCKRLQTPAPHRATSVTVSVDKFVVGVTNVARSEARSHHMVYRNLKHPMYGYGAVRGVCGDCTLLYRTRTVPAHGSYWAIHFATEIENDIGYI